MSGMPSGLNERVRGAKEASYRDLILDVAEEELAAQGFESTHMKEVAGSAAISLATLYARFPTKMDLYRAVHERRLKSLNAALADGADPSAEPLPRMLTAMRIYVTFHMTHPAWLRMHLREGNAWSGDERLRSPEQLNAWNRGLRAMAKTFRAGIEQGVFADDDPVLLGRMTNAMHQVVLSRWVDEGMKEAPDAVVAKMQARFVRAFCVPERVPEILSKLGLPRRE
jgi:AcrR family transcriptional regulator